jgi:hypothetical protein
LSGAGLAVQVMRGVAVPRSAGWLHGAVAAVGFGLLMPPLRRGLGAAGMGTELFAPIVAWLLLLALVLGIVMLVLSRWRARPHGALVAAHGSLAIAGLVVLLALLLARP